MVDFLKNNWIWIVIAILFVILVAVICWRIIKKKKVKNNKKNPKLVRSNTAPVKTNNEPIRTNEEIDQSLQEDDYEELTFESEEELDEEETEEVKKAESSRPKQYRISYDKEQRMWLIKKDGAKRVIRKTATKTEAVEIAKRMCNNQDLNLVVHKKDGKFQKKKNVR